MLEFPGALLATWPIHVLPALILAVPTVLVTRKRVSWRRADCLVLVLPWLLWCIVFAFGPRAASLSSAIGESILLGLAVGLGFVIAAFVWGRFNSSSVRVWLLASLCTIAIVVWATFPFLGE